MQLSLEDKSEQAQQVLDAAVAMLGGAARSGQEKMCAATVEALSQKSTLFVQAGTGTGKSLGYLVPALVHAVCAQEKVLVSTATLALQRQIMAKDAPIVAAALTECGLMSPKVALLKGWSNYLCRYRFEGGIPSGGDDGLFDLPLPGQKKVQAELEVLEQWVSETDTGDRDDLSSGVSDLTWRQVSIDRRACLGQKCPMVQDCFPRQAREQVVNAEIVVTNHTMLGIAANGNGSVLPEIDAIIVDEAHELADRVRASVTVELSAAMLRRAMRSARRHAGAVGDEIEKAANTFNDALEEIGGGRITGSLPSALYDSLLSAKGAISQVLGDIGRPNSSDPEYAAIQLGRSALEEVREIVDIIADASTDRMVSWITKSKDDRWLLYCAPFDVAAPIANELLENRAAIFTSATLSLGGSFAAVAGEIGAAFDKNWEGIDVGSPFDHRKQGILYVPTDLPRPGREGTDPKVLEEIFQLCKASSGGALVLCTSWRSAEQIGEMLRRRLKTKVLIQGEDSLSSLIKIFRQDQDSTLVGTRSLWQGVDVPGSSCRLVIIDRIPFPRPDDPITQARQDRAAAQKQNGFLLISCASAALALAQGAGRLLRTSSDKGLVAILDPRFITAGYGTFLQKSLPPMWGTTDRDVAHGALRRLAANIDS